MICAPEHRDNGSSGGGGGGGGGAPGSGGSVEPPAPDGLTPDEGVGFVPVDGGGGGAPAPAPVSTAALLERALSSAAFPVPTVHTAPADKTYVRLKTALWVDGFRTVSTEPAKAGAQLVRATATPLKVVWDLGEKKLECLDGGSKSGTTCHYTYQRSSAGQSGGTYKITATIRWRVEWSCVGADCQGNGGLLDPQEMTSPPTPLAVSEIQTNNH
ncbi:hypothetical protein [Actinomadura roseirufa]|uniref:hypothetical protein n=1 Tax=Actinomadura roseirufa TaxID=2094049 RepID=UPI0010410B45|nr:hypothetical protein [Actinomadura roseirufa]